MPKKFKPMRLGDIAEGRFLADIDEEIDETGKAHIAHVARFKELLGDKTKSVVTVKLTLEYDGNSDGIYELKGEISRKMPGRPSSVTRAIHEVDDNGVDTLFVRESGGDESQPRQMKLATGDGRGIDQESGKAKGEAPPSAPRRAADRRSESAGT